MARLWVELYGMVTLEVQEEPEEICRILKHKKRILSTTRITTISQISKDDIALSTMTRSGV